MAAIMVTQYRVNDGKGAEFAAIRQEMTPLIAKHGLSNRVWFGFIAGAAAGTYTSVLEAADLVALAAGVQNMIDDPVWQAVNARLIGPGGVAAVLSITQANELAVA